MIRGIGERAPGVEAVLFDLDGTLIDTVELILTSFRYATGTVLGEPLPDRMLLENIGVPLARQMREFAPVHAEELVRVYREHNAAHHDELAREYPGTREALDAIAATGRPMGVVTSKGHTMAHHGLAVFGLAHHFPVVVTADDVEVHKPDPFPLRRAAAQLGVPLERCAYVGDSPHDMAAALAGGALAIAALWGAFPAEEVLAPGPHHALSSISELPELLGRM